MSKSFRPVFLSLCSGLLLAATALAIVPPQEPPSLDGVVMPELLVRPSAERVGLEKAGDHPGLARFLGKSGGTWDVQWDRRSDRPSLIQGSGLPLIPGRGNLLKGAQVEDLDLVADALRAFLAENGDLLKVDNAQVELDASRSSLYGGYYWNVELQQHYEGLPVVGAKVFFRVNHGNLVQFGSQNVAAVRGLDPRPHLGRKAALRQVLDRAGIGFDALAEILEAGALEIHPVLAEADARPGVAYAGTAGEGYGHVLTWRTSFRVHDDPTTYEALVDAHSGRVLRLVDRNRYATVQGGILPTTTADPEEIRGFPFATVVDNGGTHVTDADGNYTYGGGTATVSLDGRYTAINDDCGAISLSSSDGELDFSQSAGTDCDTPGVGGLGNTHSARSGFYHLTNINRKAATFLPGNAWLDGTLTANMNINSTCNAFWDGSTVNFYRSGGGCGNTGEIAAVFLHEWGHGMDANSGGPAGENGSGEALGDTFAFLETRDSCIGPGFRSTPCYNCDTCTGVRDVRDFGRYGSATPATPANVESNSGIDCDRWACPYSRFGLGLFPYQGPMGYEGHCESIIASSANWTLTQLLVDAHGSAGWGVMDSIWYGSLQPAQSAYQVASGGQCNPSATVDGCGADNWYTVFLSVDDDDGNLSNGTPNGCRIWDAFNDHGIACGSRPDCTTGGGSCTPTEDPETSCSDGIDNDCDGFVDGNDADCAPSCVITENPEVSCSDGIDNDCDGLVDNADTDCQVCAPKGASCSVDGDCCSNKCRGGGSKTCK